MVTAGDGPRGRLPLTPELLLDRPSGDIFGMTQDAGMGWDPRELGRPQYLMPGTSGGIRDPDGRPVALGYHTGHWEIGLLMQAAAAELRALESLPFAGFCSDPGDGRTGPAAALDLQRRVGGPDRALPAPVDQAVMAGPRASGRT
jgi:hypothetical protein